MKENLNLAKVIGHRGACGYAPENTLIAMRKAYELGIKWVEFDVMLTQDQQAIIMHDYTLDRTTNGHGNVADKKLIEIQQLDSGSWFSSEFSNERVVTFAELLQYLAKLKLHINVEIKPTPGTEEITAKKTIEILQQHWPIEKSIPLISSGKEASLQTVYKINPELALGFITDEWLENWQQKLQSLHCISLNINYKTLTSARAAAVKAAGYYLLAYTVNDPMIAKQLFSWGVDAVFSDFPDRILAIF